MQERDWQTEENLEDGWKERQEREENRTHNWAF